MIWVTCARGEARELGLYWFGENGTRCGIPIVEGRSVQLFTPLPPVPIGVDDFRKLRERGLLYVDKSHLIREVLDRAGIEVVVLPRPHRFGKGFGLSMLRWFFEKRDEDLSHLFEGLAIWRAGDAYRQHFQHSPVIHVTFKNVRPATCEEFCLRSSATARARSPGSARRRGWQTDTLHLSHV